MLRLESLLCSLRAICFGIPLGLGLSYVMYLLVSVSDGWGLDFDVPWLVILQSTLAVFVLTWAVMLVASRKTRDGSIVEAIRGEGAA
jgi:putative ABC transport system permease protein